MFSSGSSGRTVMADPHGFFLIQPPWISRASALFLQKNLDNLVLS